MLCEEVASGNSLTPKKILNEKVALKYYCTLCDYSASKKCDYTKHLLTRKHTNSDFSNKKSQKLLSCGNCNFQFKSNSGLWYHKSRCSKNTEINNIEDVKTTNLITTMNNEDITNLFLESVKQNQELQKQMFELFKDNIGSNNTVNSNNNTMNNQFNLQFFLNETCKDAMNINDFIDYVKVKLEDFENFGAVGYPKALGEIIVRNLNELDVKMRPIHCSDLKREVLHVKHDGVWHSDESREFMKRSIMYIAHKNIKQIPTWQDKNPESKNCNTKTFDRYNKMFRASLGPANEEEKDDYLKKITGMIAKEVVIDKKKKY